MGHSLSIDDGIRESSRVIWVMSNAAGDEPIRLLRNSITNVADAASSFNITLLNDYKRKSGLVKGK